MSKRIMPPPTRFSPARTPAVKPVSTASSAPRTAPPPTRFAPGGRGSVQPARGVGARMHAAPSTRQIQAQRAARTGIAPPPTQFGRSGAVQARGVVQRAVIATSQVWHCATCAGGGVDESFDWYYAEQAPTWACQHGHINWAAGPSPVAPVPAPVVVAPVVPQIEYPFPSTGVPRYLYRWCTKSAAQNAVANGITKTGGVHDGIPTLVKPGTKSSAENGGGIGIRSAEACLRIDTDAIPEIHNRQANSVNFVKGRNNSEYKVLVSIPAEAIEKIS